MADAPISPTPDPLELSEFQYRSLAELRHRQRQFLHWSEEQARAAGLTATQHQLLLGIRAADHPDGPTIGDIADFLMIRPHSAVELVDRAERLGLCARQRHAGRVRLRLSAEGNETLRALSVIHLHELSSQAAQMVALWSALAEADRR